METEKLTISLLESGAGGGNRTPASKAWEAGNKTLKTLELAALSRIAEALNWKIDEK
jgi:hypothetical protein